MIPGMNTIHDVLRFILSKLGGQQAAEQDIARALAVVAAHEAAHGGPAEAPAPDPAVAELAAAQAEIARLQALVDAAPPAPVHEPAQGGF